MELLHNERIIWESKNKRLLLTSHRLREMHKSVFGSKIKSIMLEELTSSELRTSHQFPFLREAILYFLVLNGSVFLLNNYLFKAEIIKFFFDHAHIGSNAALFVFYLSIFISLIYLFLFFFSVKKVFSFYSKGITIEFQIRWLNFDERESFISKVENAKDQCRK